MAEHDDDIDALLRHLDNGYWPAKHAALTALIAERNELREQLRLANIDQFNTEAEANERDRDLRERLVCAALTGLCADPSFDDSVSRAAIAIADDALAAMRKGEA